MECQRDDAAAMPFLLGILFSRTMWNVRPLLKHKRLAAGVSLIREKVESAAESLDRGL